MEGSNHTDALRKVNGTPCFIQSGNSQEAAAITLQRSFGIHTVVMVIQTWSRANSG